ncbi:MAG: HD domain-containing phosphohydrolase [Burkholderiaceae bacterium]
MTQAQLANLSLAELRDRLQARADVPTHGDDLDPLEVLHYFVALPASSHTADSILALIHLTRITAITAQPAVGQQSASLASRIAIAANNQPLLSRARNKEGYTLVKLGRFAEATIAQAEAWSIARELGDKDLEMNAVWGFSTIFVAMGQWNVAIRYCERMRALAEEIGLPRYEFIARNNLADCILQLRDPVSATRVLSKLAIDAPHADIEPSTHAHLHNNLARASLLTGDTDTANSHVQKAAAWAATWGMASVTHCVKAVKGLVDVRLGFIDSGLSAVRDALDFAKNLNRAEVPDSLGICIDAYEAAGRLDEALLYLRELVEWKKESIDAQLTAQPLEGLTDSIQLQTGTSLFDDQLLAKMHTLHAGVQSRVERLLEIALNAETASGHDIYRLFRVGNLARYLATALGWDDQAIAPLVLGAQLGNIGMIAIPARILFKPDRLSEGEIYVLRSHTEYGAELLRKAKLQILDLAAVIAEQHHERFDGSGYPRHLSGEAISEGARLVAVCDAFDAMTHERPWRRAPLSLELASNELTKGAGSHFDPRIVNAFLAFIEREFPKHDDFDAFLAEGADEIEYVRVRARVEAMLADDNELRV